MNLGGEDITDVFLYLLRRYSHMHYFSYTACDLRKPQDRLTVRAAKEETATFSQVCFDAHASMSRGIAHAHAHDRLVSNASSIALA